MEQRLSQWDTFWSQLRDAVGEWTVQVSGGIQTLAAKSDQIGGIV
jgi:hypothetical protein